LGFLFVLIGLTLFLVGREAQTGVVPFLLEAILVYTVPSANYETGRLKKPVTDIAFRVNADRAVGLDSQLAHFRRKAEKRCIMLLS
jgi:hypothetical protein